ncbi:MAG: hypothetical protein EU517_00190 [Promethearchaeota archaeon]|nr:MAG: hypothetical protein EU517_00190 [Candidatus Lokiarchaeota archaeon]
MSLEEKDELPDLESVPLFDYLRQEIPVEDIRDFSSPKRIYSIDFVKGFAIVFIILAHTGSAWFDSEWIYLYGIVYALLDILGPSLFVFLSALSVIFSIKRKQGVLPEKVIRNRIFNRGLVIAIIGIFFNLISIEFTIEGVPFPLNLWGWNILMFIGFSQIFSYYALKINKIGRVIVGIFIIFSSDTIREFLITGKDAGNPLITFLHYIIISPAPMTPLIPWLSICFISTIFGEYLYDAMIDGSKQAYKMLFRIFFYWGSFLILYGIATGLTLYHYDPASGLPILSENEFPHIQLLKIANSQMIIPSFRFPGMPEFLIRGRGPNMWYNLGCALVIIAVSFYYIDLKRKRNNFISMLEYYGKVSLSMFLVHYAFITLFVGFFNIMFFPFIYFAFVGFMGFLLYIWIEFAGGVGTPEWIMLQIGRIGQKTSKSIKKETRVIKEEFKEGVKRIKKKA